MKLSNQAMGAMMMALQRSLMEQSDITDMLRNFDFTLRDEELFVENPPIINTSQPGETDERSARN
tara:strand:- start:2277 stop:2471 length:195 start_codon:yes stop_codon:yes gene_type:complete